MRADSRVEAVQHDHLLFSLLQLRVLSDWQAKQLLATAVVVPLTLANLQPAPLPAEPCKTVRPAVCQSQRQLSNSGPLRSHCDPELLLSKLNLKADCFFAAAARIW